MITDLKNKGTSQFPRPTAFIPIYDRQNLNSLDKKYSATQQTDKEKFARPNKFMPRFNEDDSPPNESLHFELLDHDILKNALKARWDKAATKESTFEEAWELVSEALESARPDVAPSSQLQGAKLPWPTETYSDAHRNRGVNIAQFLDERYAELIDAGQVTRPKLREHDPSADTAVANYLRGGRQLPDHLHIPTKSETIDRQLKELRHLPQLSHKPSVTPEVSLARAIVSRHRRRQLDRT